MAGGLTELAVGIKEELNGYGSRAPNRSFEPTAS